MKSTPDQERLVKVLSELNLHYPRMTRDVVEDCSAMVGGAVFYGWLENA
jgi:hypothetical protein